MRRKSGKLRSGLVMRNRQDPKVQMKQARTPTTPAESVSQHITSEVVECSPEVSQNAGDTPLPFWLKPFWLKPFSLKRCIAHACAEVLFLEDSLLRSWSVGGHARSAVDVPRVQVLRGPRSPSVKWQRCRSLAPGEVVEVLSTPAQRCPSTRVQAQPGTRVGFRRRCGRGEEARGGDRSSQWGQRAHQVSPSSVAH